METQDHRTPKQSGHEGHSGGGAHVCHKCGWPFPNPHPSAKHRRAHKKVCGSLEGYMLDNDAPEKTQLMDGEHVSDDDSKTPSGKVVENVISRRSSSGIGSRSSRSNRSEEELFADAVTDFADGSGHGEASDGVIQRFYSLQSVTENDISDTTVTAENGENLHASTDGQDELQTEAGTLSQNYISSSSTGPAIASISTAEEKESNFELETEQSSETSHVLNIVAVEREEIVSSKDKSDLVTSYNETAEVVSKDVSALRAGDYEIQSSVAIGEIAKSTEMLAGSSEVNADFSEVVDVPSNFSPLENPVKIIDPANGSINKSRDVIENDVSMAETYDVDVHSVPEALPMHKHPEATVEDVDFNRGDIDTLNALGAVSYATKEGVSGNDVAEIGDSKNIRREENVVGSVENTENEFKQDLGQKSIDDFGTVGEPSQIPDFEASDPGVSEVKSEVITEFETKCLESDKIRSAEEQKPTISSENVSPEIDSAAADNLEYASTRAANTSNDIDDGTEHVLLEIQDRELTEKDLSEEQKNPIPLENASPELVSAVADNGTSNEVINGTEGVQLEIQDRELTGKGLSGSSSVDECAINDIPPLIKEPRNDDRISGGVQIHSDENEMRSAGEDNDVVNAETIPGCQARINTENVHEPLEHEKTSDHGKSETITGFGDSKVGGSLPKMEGTGGSSGGGEYVKCSEEASGVVAGDMLTKQLIAGSAVDVVPDSSSQTDSLDGNWGSVSVMSTISDTPPAADAPAADTPASNQSCASTAKENATLEPKPVMESQQPESKTSAEPYVGIRKTEGVSEIQMLEEQQPTGSALQTAWSSSVAHADNASHGGTRDEIITKVTNWSTEKQHTALKTLLGEATARSRAESPIHPNQSSTSEPQTDKIPAANNGFSKTENSDPSSTKPTAEKSEEMGKEWNSPARYPVNIKTEKKRSKSKLYWAPFLCCSSVNAR